MEFISLVFRLGVVLAIFSFIWGLIRFGLTILRGGMPLPYTIALALKTIQYFLIVDITIRFCESTSESLTLDLILSGLILLMYFIGKVQNMKTRFMIVQIQSRNFQQQQPYKPNINLEFAVIALSLALFAFLAFQPDYATNAVSDWFYSSITEIEKAPIFGFIFKVVGFFFTISILFRMISAFTVLLSGQPFNNNQNGQQNQNDRDDDRFDDYEEMK
jgi:hypothetical protein